MKISSNNVFNRSIKSVIIIIIIFTAYTICSTPFSNIAYGQTAAELQAKIEQRNQDIKNLENEIKGYQTQINDLSSQASSLSSTIKSLQLTQKKLEANIALTEDRIATKTLEIQQLGSKISTKQNNISDDQRIVAQSFKQLDQMGNTDMADIIFGSNSVSDALNTLDELSLIQKNVFDKISALTKDKDQLQVNKSASEKAKADLVTLNKELADQRKVVLSTVSEQNALLMQTNQSEAEYQKLVKQRSAQKAAFEKELFAYESALRISIDFSKLPARGSSVLSWPLDNIYITQLFGVTSDSLRLYASGSHGGVDFRASIGTPVRASLSGTVVDLEKTTARKGCQYGYWVLLRHPNGLSTLYGHLSLVNVSVGQSVSTDQIIGYSGNTGFSEGPHLHFGVYATTGIKVVLSQALNSSTNCKNIKTVAADPKAYLDPMSYLPPR